MPRRETSASAYEHVRQTAVSALNKLRRDIRTVESELSTLRKQEEQLLLITGGGAAGGRIRGLGQTDELARRTRKTAQAFHRLRRPWGSRPGQQGFRRNLCGRHALDRFGTGQAQGARRVRAGLKH